MDVAEVLRDLAILYEDRFREAGAIVVPPDDKLSLRCITFPSDLKIALHEVLLNSAEAFEQPQCKPSTDRWCRLMARQAQMVPKSESLTMVLDSRTWQSSRCFNYRVQSWRAAWSG